MFALQVGSLPTKHYRAFVARAAVAALIATLGGCATDKANYAASDARIAQAAIDVEDDGLPAQTPPPVRIRQQPDDPSEPYSRNYGGVNPSASIAPDADEQPPEHAPQPAIPSDLPPVFRQKLVAAMTSDE